MKNSIRKKLFFQIGLLVILLISLLILANSIFLEPFYTSIKKNRLLEIYDTINAMDTADYEAEMGGLNDIEAKTRFEIIIGTDKDHIIYTTNPRIDKIHFITDKPGKYLLDKNRPKLELLTSEAINELANFHRVIDVSNGMHSFLLEGELDNGYIIALFFPIASVQANIDIVNQFLIIIGIIVLIIAILVAYLISKSFTEPILSMNEVTKKMIQLDFKETCEVMSNDEIGQLSESINELSHELSTSIDNLHDKNKELEKKVLEKKVLAEKRKELLSNVSHELKTPLSLIQGYAEGLNVMIKEKPENIPAYSEIILDEAIKMNDLIERMLNVDQIENGHLIINKETFDIHEMITTQLHSLENLIHSQHIDVKHQGKSYHVQGDYLLIERVIINLLTNAIYHSRLPKTIMIDYGQATDKIRVSISNSSSPLSQRELDNIWDSFYKIDEARTRDKGGHGLGLSIVKAILDSHEYNYGVHQSKGHITFWFELPYIYGT